MTYVKLAPPENPGTNNVTGYVLERDPDGTITKEVKLGVPVNINKEERELLEGLGAKFIDSSAEESKEYEANQALNQVGDDVAGAAPVFAQTPPTQASTVTDPTPTEQTSTDQSADAADSSSAKSSSGRNR